jgi:hypothetical protein
MELSGLLSFWKNPKMQFASIVNTVKFVTHISKVLSIALLGSILAAGLGFELYEQPVLTVNEEPHTIPIDTPIEVKITHIDSVSLFHYVIYSFEYGSDSACFLQDQSAEVIRENLAVLTFARIHSFTDNTGMTMRSNRSEIGWSYYKNPRGEEKSLNFMLDSESPTLRLVKE